MSAEQPGIEDITIHGPPVTEDVKLDGPPGSGKTTSATGRVGKCVKDHDYDFSNVVWVTFRRSLAADTRRTLVKWGVLPEGELDSPKSGQTKWISTVHAVAARTVSDRIAPNVTMVRPKHRAYFAHEVLNVRYEAPDKKPWLDSPGKLAFDCYDWLQNNELPPSEVYRCPHYDDWLDAWGHDPLPMDEFAAQWEAHKGDEELMDFHEQLELAIEAAEEGEYPGADETPSIVVCDEYHDVYPMMNTLMQKWMDAADVAIACGDPRQVVNAYDGASPRYFEGLDLERVELPRSYRVPTEHWQMANDLLSRAHDPPEVKSKSGGDVYRTTAPTMSHDYETGWETPRGRGSPTWTTRQFDEGSLIHLTRTRKQAKGVAAHLRRYGVLYTGQQGMDGWHPERNRVRVKVYNALQTFWGVEIVGEDDDGSPVLGWTDWAESSDNIETDRDPNADIEYEWVEELIDNSDPDLFDEVRTGEVRTIKSFMSTDDDLDVKAVIEYLGRDWFAEMARGPSSLDWLDLDPTDDRAIQAALPNNSRGDLIETGQDITTRVMTIHASKGLEADHVALYEGVTSRVLDSVRSDGRMEENEWRTWYVAATRARQTLIVVQDAFDYMEPWIPPEIIHQHCEYLTGDAE